ncbi:hypothetical protein [Sorangium cellulosum]|uniref:Uncharacterized protein n=1 Tax=Sorangium cellulosum So0157-2 TaxID=1254432 RepID=S4XVQ4_SORCE|nr:hypothetical protein [Sorangium cellulosum]AGP36416.1 hypothetical protein SCE1572_19125 [Sorangium cellulosum So0157-2]
MTARPALADLDADAIERGLSAAVEALEARADRGSLVDWVWWTLADAHEGSRARGELSAEDAAGNAYAWLAEAAAALVRVMAPPSRGPVLALSLHAVTHAPDEMLRPGTLLELVRAELQGGEGAARRAARIASMRRGKSAVDSLVLASALLPLDEASAWFDEALTQAAALRPDELARTASGAIDGLGSERAKMLYDKIQSRGGAPREWLVALAPQLPDDARAGAIEQARAWATEGTVMLDGKVRRALVACVDAAQCLAWLDEAGADDAVALVERLAALGLRDQGLSAFDRRFSEPLRRMEARLAAYGTGSPSPRAIDHVRGATSGLDAARWAELIKRHAPVLVAFFEEAELVARLARLEDAMGIEARAALAPFVGAPLRRRLLREAVSLQRDAGDTDTLAALARCARWLEIEEAIALSVLELPVGSLEELLREHGSLWWTAPLLHRAVGDEGLVEVARVIAEALLGYTPPAHGAAGFGPSA